MRITPVNYNISSYTPIQKNKAQKSSIKNNASYVQNPPTFTGLSSGRYAITETDLTKISELIGRADSQRLDETGKTVQGVYQYGGKYMVKSPDTLTHDTTLKEFAILSKIRELKGGDEICPKPYDIAQCANRPFLVEEFIKGKHAGELPITLKDTEKLTEKLLILDKAGIINQDLSPRNVIYMPNGQTRMIDFDTFSYLTGDGRTIHSQSTPIEYFANLVPKEKLKHISSGSLGDYDFKNLDLPLEERFAASFACETRRPSGVRDLNHARNIAENPFIGVPSNLSNYEARTIYTRMMDHDIEDPVRFLQDYIQMKTEKYHKPMREFLKKLCVKEEYCDNLGDRIPFEKAKERLRNAIKFEDIYINLFSDEKPDIYFAKLQAAEIQLNALVADAQISKRISNNAQLPKAYENVIRVLVEGLNRYDDPDRRFYLESQLEHYKDVFSRTNLSIIAPKYRIDSTMDILDMWFSDPAFDGNSFANLGLKAKSALISLFTENGIRENQTVSNEVIEQAEAMLRRELEPSEIKVPKDKFDEGVKNLLSKIMEEARTLKEQAPSKPPAFKYDKNGAVTNIAEVFGIYVPKLNSCRKPDEALEYFGNNYETAKYVKSGNKLFIGFFALAAVGAGALYRYMQSKNSKQEQQKQVIIETNKNLYQTNLAKIVLKDEKSPFKNFVI